MSPLWPSTWHSIDLWKQQCVTEQCFDLLQIMWPLWVRPGPVNIYHQALGLGVFMCQGFTRSKLLLKPSVYWRGGKSLSLETGTLYISFAPLYVWRDSHTPTEQRSCHVILFAKCLNAMFCTVSLWGRHWDKLHGLKVIRARPWRIVTFTLKNWHKSKR